MHLIITAAAIAATVAASDVPMIDMLYGASDVEGLTIHMDTRGNTFEVEGAELVDDMTVEFIAEIVEDFWLARGSWPVPVRTGSVEFGFVDMLNLLNAEI